MSKSLDHPVLREHLTLGFELMANLADGILARFDASAEQIEGLRSLVDDIRASAVPLQKRVLERLERIEAEVASIRSEISGVEPSA